MDKWQGSEMETTHLAGTEQEMQASSATPSNDPVL